MIRLQPLAIFDKRRERSTMTEHDDGADDGAVADAGFSGLGKIRRLLVSRL
jgi:hypothetical protein